MSKHTREVFDIILSDNPNLNFDDLLFQIPYQRIQSQLTTLKKTKVLHPDYTFHTFRHTFASIFFKIKGTNYDSLLRLQQIMGHNDLKMSLHYVHLYDTFNRNILEDLSFNGAEKIAENKFIEEKKEYIVSQIKIVEIEDMIHISVPYDKEIIPAYKEIEGKWDNGQMIWKFNKAVKDKVLKILKEKYGYEEKVDMKKEISDIKEKLDKLLSR